MESIRTSSLELGVAANWRNLLFGLDLAAVIDGTRGLNAENESAFEDSGRTIVLLGLGLRVGWSEWAAR